MTSKDEGGGKAEAEGGEGTTDDGVPAAMGDAGGKAQLPPSSILTALLTP